MTFTVLWRSVAEEHLAELWMNSPIRAAIAAAADMIDALLRSDPLGQGESREGTERIMFQQPLGVLYDVREQDRIVYVLTVGLLRQH